MCITVLSVQIQGCNPSPGPCTVGTSSKCPCYTLSDFLGKVRVWLCGDIYAHGHTECDMDVRSEITEIVDGVLVSSQGGEFLLRCDFLIGSS